MNIIVKKSIAYNEILSLELEVNVGFGIRLQSYTVTNTVLYNYISVKRRTLTRGDRLETLFRKPQLAVTEA